MMSCNSIPYDYKCVNINPSPDRNLFRFWDVIYRHLVLMSNDEIKDCQFISKLKTDNNIVYFDVSVFARINIDGEDYEFWLKPCERVHSLDDDFLVYTYAIGGNVYPQIKDRILKERECILFSI